MGKAHLEYLLILFQDLLRLCKVSVEMVRCCKTNPVLAEVGTQSEECMTRFYQVVIESELCLQVCSIAQDIQVVLGYGVILISHLIHLAVRTNHKESKWHIRLRIEF